MLVSESPAAPDPAVLHLVASGAGRGHLVPLRDAASTAREAVLVARALPNTSPALLAARRAYLGALVDYVQALTDHGLPVPARLRDDLRLLRRVVPAERTTG
ncbi:hypothetical protein GCM10025782_29740 [Pedococcus ginsenosidimutans]|uniref:Uncharacterized protein n=1 Tax=Pedococcus ginsenosidimutans TaxID=490570 RepID=A0ABP8YKY2_9MICO